MNVTLESRVQELEQMLQMMIEAMNEWRRQWLASLEEERRERQKALEEERRARQKALEEARQAQQKALEEERRARQKALEEARQAQQKALEEERRARQKALEEARQAWQKSLQELTQQVQALFQNLDRRIQELWELHRRLRIEENKRWGEMARRLGTLVEDLLYPSLPFVLEEVFGCSEDTLMLKSIRTILQDEQTKEFTEIDAWAVCPEFVLIMEIKSQPRVRDIQEFVQKLKHIRRFLPSDFRNRPIYGAFAAPHLPDNLIRFGEKQGLIMLAIGVNLLDIQNSAGFKPKAF